MMLRVIDGSAWAHDVFDVNARHQLAKPRKPCRNVLRSASRIINAE